MDLPWFTWSGESHPQVPSAAPGTVTGWAVHDSFHWSGKSMEINHPRLMESGFSMCLVHLVHLCSFVYNIRPLKVHWVHKTIYSLRFGRFILMFVVSLHLVHKVAGKFYLLLHVASLIFPQSTNQWYNWNLLNPSINQTNPTWSFSFVQFCQLPVTARPWSSSIWFGGPVRACRECSGCPRHRLRWPPGWVFSRGFGVVNTGDY